MIFDPTKLGPSVLRIVFGLGPPITRACAYVRPMGRNRLTGLVSPSELVAACLALVGRWSLPQWSPVVLAAGTERLVVRAADLASVPAPGAGDLLVENSSGAAWRLVAAVLDGGGLFWVFQGERRGDEYWGDLLGAVGSRDDRGDLGAATVAENWLEIV
jgi:hypothetical protein